MKKHSLKGRIIHLSGYISGATVACIFALIFISSAVAIEGDKTLTNNDAGSNSLTGNAVKEISSIQSFDLWKNNRDRIKVIDCRTEDEFRSGHPEMALNIPLEYMLNGSVTRNPDFLSEVRKVADKNDTVMIICRTGRRSLIAGHLLLQAGFRDVINISDGFEGKIKKGLSSGSAGSGWKNSNLPWKK